MANAPVSYTSGLLGRSIAVGRACWETLTGVSYALSEGEWDCAHPGKNRSWKVCRARLVPTAPPPNTSRQCPLHPDFSTDRGTPVPTDRQLCQFHRGHALPPGDKLALLTHLCTPALQTAQNRFAKQPSTLFFSFASQILKASSHTPCPASPFWTCSSQVTEAGVSGDAFLLLPLHGATPKSASPGDNHQA